PAAIVPAYVTLPPGATTASFTVNTTAVTTPTMAVLSATYAGITKTATLLLSAPFMTAFSVSPSAVADGVSATGTLTLNDVAPAGGATVALSSNDPAATVPA